MTSTSLIIINSAKQPIAQLIIKPIKQPLLKISCLITVIITFILEQFTYGLPFTFKLHERYVTVSKSNRNRTGMVSIVVLPGILCWPINARPMMKLAPRVILPFVMYNFMTKCHEVI